VADTGRRGVQGWEERFGEARYTAIGLEAIKLALDAAGIGASDVDTWSSRG